jgi:hypothetical protein
LSETFSPGQDQSICFKFFYHAYGDSIGTLSIYLADSNATKTSILWQLSGQQSKNGYDWKQGIVPITSITQDYKIIIEGTVGKGKMYTSHYSGDIA